MSDPQLINFFSNDLPALAKPTVGWEALLSQYIGYVNAAFCAGANRGHFRQAVTHHLDLCLREFLQRKTMPTMRTAN